MFGSKHKKQQPMENLLDHFAPAPIPPVFNISMPPQTIVKENEYRPCYVNGRRALFHCWTNSARPKLPNGQEPGENARYFQFRTTHGLVEYEDGTVDLVWPSAIKFAGNGRFKDYTWDPMEQGDENAESQA